MGTKAAEIKKVLTQFPHYTNEEVKIHLSRQGIEVSLVYIYILRTPARKKENEFTVFADKVLRVKAFVQVNGGLEEVRELVADAEDLLNDVPDFERMIDFLERIS